MPNSLSLRASLWAVVTCSTMALSSTALAATPSKLVVFGDSLSDTGNLAALLGGAVPGAPYYHGRFSNGPVAVEVMAQTLGVTLEDHAYGGAKTGTDSYIGAALNGTGVQGQISHYLSANAGGLDASALYVVWAGGNDFFGTPLPATVGTASQNLTNDVLALYNAGARQFFIPTLPDLQYTADVIASGPTAQAGAHLLSTFFNNTLTAAMANVQAASPGAHIQVFDVNPVLDGIRGNYANSTTGCWSGNFYGAAAGGTLCSDPADHFLWDQVHPTASVHLAVGTAFAAAVVPEPETYALMLSGLLVTAGMMGRRRARLSIKA